MKLNVNYDPSALTLEGASAGDFDGTSFGPADNVPFAISLGDSINGNNSTNGVVAQLEFTIKDSTPEGEYPISLDYEFADVFDNDYEDVYFGVVDGTVTVISHTPGDISDDGKINMKDLSKLQPFINGWNVEINEAAADVNGDGKVNMKDYALIQRYINGWDVELK